MKKSLFKGLILGVVFVVSIILFSNIFNKDLSEKMETMRAPTLPVLYMEISDMIINPMYGNAQEMKPQYVRESITPLTTKCEMELAVDGMSHTIGAIEYQVYTADGSEMVESGKLSGLKKEESYEKVQFALKNRILMNQEYVICFVVDYGEESPAYYYTRIVQRAGLNTSQYLNFIRDFYEKCISKETATGLTQYIEPSDRVKNTSFTRININSSFDQLTWGSLSPTITRRAIPTIREINSTTCSIVQEYEISAQDSEQNMEYYQVEEFYRMRYARSRVMLLDFERDAQQIFDANLPVATNAGLNLGVVNTDFSYTGNQNADIVAFVQKGELWSYNRSSNKAAHVFGFRGDSEETIDVRRTNSDHNIRIIRVGESGDIDFVVYGYMNAGDHEGSTGIAVYRYSAERNVTEELVFVPSTVAYDFLKEDVEKLSYVSQGNHLYLLLMEQLLDIDLTKKSCEVILENISADCLVVSKSQRTIAWMDEEDSKWITMMDLTTGATKQIDASSGEKCKVLGFINEDLIYGNAREQDIVTDEQGDTVFAMYTVKIQSFSGKVVKDFTPQGRWVSDASIQEGLVELSCVSWENGSYVQTQTEEIMNNVPKTGETVDLHLSVSERKGTQVALDFSKAAAGSNILVLTAELVDIEDDITVEVEIPKIERNAYYIYAKGRLYQTEPKVNRAIQVADAAAGVVLNEKQQYVWERGNRPDREQLNTSDLPAAVLAGTLDEQGLAGGLGENYTVLNMTGCTLDSVLYQVGQGRAVIARQPDGTGVVIVGYDNYNTILYNPATQETYYYGMNDSTALFESAGNVFVSYMETLESKIGT